MTFTIIGTGNMAWFVGNRLVAARHVCKGVFGRNELSVRKLAEALLCNKYGPVHLAKDVEADVCIIAISDDAIEGIAKKLSYKKTVLIHTAGAVSLDILKSAAVDTAVLWPVYSISGTNNPSQRNIPIAWEASTPKAEKYILSLAHAISDVLFKAKYEQRKWLHISAVFSNNFVNHLMTICEQICNENEVPFTTMEPIIAQTYARFKQTSPANVQTGPAMRGDQKTIKEQTQLLSMHPEWQKIYSAITDSIQSMYTSENAI
jgi:predicted short-subunit dehydrogenase-like oxidoreductase (DUF2520 family)